VIEMHKIGTIVFGIIVGLLITAIIVLSVTFPAPVVGTIVEKFTEGSWIGVDYYFVIDFGGGIFETIEVSTTEYFTHEIGQAFASSSLGVHDSHSVGIVLSVSALIPTGIAFLGSLFD